MLGKLRPRSIYDVMAAIACFVALAGGTAYAADTIRTGDIVDNQVFTTDVRDDTLGFGGLQRQDLGPNAVGSSEIGYAEVNRDEIHRDAVDGLRVGDGTLNDEDIAQAGGVFVNFTGNIGTVAAHWCVNREVIGINATRDHLLLTPNYNTTSSFLTYGVEYLDSGGSAYIKVCNPTSGAINDGTTNFNLLVINAQ